MDACMTSREAALIACGPEAVRGYEQVKTFYTRFGSALERAFASAVGGRVGQKGRKGQKSEADVITRLGEWEFCAAANSKNSDGNAAQRAKVPAGFIVQVSGRPAPGRISAIDFLKFHGVVRPDRVAGECEIEALNDARLAAESKADALTLELGL